MLSRTLWICEKRISLAYILLKEVTTLNPFHTTCIQTETMYKISPYKILLLMDIMCLWLVSVNLR